MKHQFEKRDFFTNLRLALGLPIAAMVTAGLFLVMAGLIAGPETVTGEKGDEIRDIVIVRELGESDPPRELPQTPETITAPPPPSSRTDFSSDRPDGGFSPGPTKPDMTPDREIVLSTVIFPDIKFPFSYPARCAQKGVEGVVVVEFDLAPDGSVINPRIVSTPDQCFARDTLRGIKKWKYPPAANGKIRRNIRERIDFRLTD